MREDDGNQSSTRNKQPAFWFTSAHESAWELLSFSRDKCYLFWYRLRSDMEGGSLAQSSLVGKGSVIADQHHSND
jgi:hypothetical protein